MRVSIPDGFTAESIASLCGVNPATIYRALDGKGSGPVAIQIHHVTHGAIPAWEMRPDLWAEGQIPPPPVHFSPPEAA